MGGVKQDWLEDQDRIEKGLRIAIAAGVLKRCAMHDEVVIEDSGQREDAHELGRQQFAAGELRSLFKAEQDVISAIDRAIDDNNADDCGRCQKEAAS